MECVGAVINVGAAVLPIFRVGGAAAFITDLAAAVVQKKKSFFCTMVWSVAVITM